MRTHERITLEDSTQSALMKMCDGNPGALTCLMFMLQDGDEIDPDSPLGAGLMAMLALDSAGIYGTDIYMLWSDICKQSTPKMMAVLRAMNRGWISRDVVRDAASRQDYSGRAMIPVDELYEKVIKEYPGFDKKNRNPIEG